MKGQSDGCDRDDTVLNVTLCIDISGSMSSWLSQQNTHEVKKEKKNRLQLAVEAIKMFYSKLRSNDSFGLISFNQNAKLLIKQTKKEEIKEEELFSILNSLRAGGS